MDQCSVSLCRHHYWLMPALAASPWSLVYLSQAKIYHSLGDRATAAHYYQLNLERLDAEAAMGQDAVDALLFLAEYSKVLTHTVCHRSVSIHASTVHSMLLLCVVWRLMTSKGSLV